MGGGLKSGQGTVLKSAWGSKPRPSVTDAQWQEFKTMSASEKLRVLHNHDDYYNGIRLRWIAEAGLGADGQNAWQRQLTKWTADNNAQVDAMLAAKGLA